LNKKNHSLTSELLRQLAIVSAIPIVVTAVFFFLLLLPRLEDNIAKQQQSLAKLVATQTSQYIQSAADQLNLFVHLLLNTSSQPVNQSALDAFIAANPYFESLYILDDEGLIVAIGASSESAESTGLYLGMDMSQVNFMKNIRDGSSQRWSDVFLSVVTGRLSIAYIVQLDNQLIVAEAVLDRLPRLSQQLSDEQFLVMILDESRSIIAHPNPEISRQQENLGNLPLFSKSSDATLVSDNIFWNNTHYFGTAVKMETPHWYVVIAQEHAVFSQPLYVTLQIWFTSILLILLLSIHSAYRRASSLSRRFEILNEQSARITCGDYSVKPYHDEVREFQELAGNMRSMAEAIELREASLQQSEQELRLINSELEDRVNERTFAQATTNEELQSTLNTLQETMRHLIQSEKMAALGHLVAGVAHEMNTPIGNALMASTALHDFADRIRKDLYNGDIRKSTLEAFLDDALSSARITERNLQKASELITSFKQVAVDQSSSQRRPFFLAEVVDEILLTQKPLLKKHLVTITAEVPATIEIDGYPGALGQVLSNLVSNSCVHAFATGTDNRIRIQAEADNEAAILLFEDNGTGMDMKVMKRIFDPFFTTRRGQGGSGLGLHIVHNIIAEVLGGMIKVDSEKDHGTRFTLTLPLCSPEPGKPADEIQVNLALNG
jgi:signal transduction histidine kinase